MDVTHEDAIKFLEKLDISTTCTQCGHDRSIIPTKTIAHDTFVEYFTIHGRSSWVSSPDKDGRTGISLGGETYDTLPIICPRCGYVRHFLLNYVQSVLKDG